MMKSSELTYLLLSHASVWKTADLFLLSDHTTAMSDEWAVIQTPRDTDSVSKNNVNTPDLDLAAN